MNFYGLSVGIWQSKGPIDSALNDKKCKFFMSRRTVSQKLFCFTPPFKHQKLFNSVKNSSIFNFLAHNFHCSHNIEQNLNCYIIRKLATLASTLLEQCKIFCSAPQILLFLLLLLRLKMKNMQKLYFNRIMNKPVALLYVAV